MSETVTPQLRPLRHREIEANGTTFHLAEAGSGEPVLLLAAFPLHAHTWRRAGRVRGRGGPAPAAG
ncbi:hypothetical protein DN069_22925, partial [Streptacidiphilus pinicola]